MKVEPKTLSGFMELLPQQQILFEQIKETIKQNYKKFGFVPLDTPILESAEVLLAKVGGETEKQIYCLEKGDNKLCMRFDLTVPLAKYVAANSEKLVFPFKRYQIGKVYRGERPQKGRYREFYQCDIDIIGNGTLSLINDAEIPAVMYNIFKQLNIGEFVINISNRKLLLGLMEHLNLEGQSEDILRIIDKFDKIGKQVFKQTLINDYKIMQEKVESILNFVEISGSVDEQIACLQKLDIKNQTYLAGCSELSEVVKYLKYFNVSENNFAINLRIARGLDYYTGTVYETFLKGYENLGSVCSGGRYENLAEYYTDKKLPGVGMCIGLTRLFDKLLEANLITAKNPSVSKILITYMGDYTSSAIKLCAYLQQNNINAQVYFEDTKFKNKINYANKLQIPYIAILGEDEIKGGYISVKNLNTFEQSTVSAEQLINLLI